MATVMEGNRKGIRGDGNSNGRGEGEGNRKGTRGDGNRKGTRGDGNSNGRGATGRELGMMVIARKGVSNQEKNG